MFFLFVDVTLRFACDLMEVEPRIDDLPSYFVG